MPNMSWVGLLNAGQYNQENAGTAYASSTSATDISAGGNTAGQALLLPASYLVLGTQLRVTANGIVSNTSTPNLTLGVYYGGVAGTALTSTGAVATASSLSTNQWKLEALIRVVSVGTSGSMYTTGTVVGPYAGTQFMPANGTSPLVSSLNTGTANILTIGATWGTNSASNTIQCLQFCVEQLN